MASEVRIPPLGESITEGTIVRWAKRDGETVAPDEILLELETDKASTELPAERGGVLRILKPEGATVVVGEVVARIEDAAGASAPQPSAAAPPRPAPVEAPRAAAPPVESPRAAAAPAAEPESAAARGVGPLSPAVRRLVSEHQLDPRDIPASGKGGRLTKDDVQTYLERRANRVAPRSSIVRPGAPPPRPAPAPAARPAPPAAAPRPVATPPPRPQAVESMPAVSRPAVAAAVAGDGEEPVPMSRIRRRIAERLVEAQRTAAILTTFNEIDMTAVMALRSELKERFQQVHGVALGFMSFFARACISALRELPVVNAEIRGEDIVYKHFVHLGVAVGTERGLVVPVVHHADRLSFAEIEREIGRLAGLARQGKLSLDDLSGGTFTISNGGVYGSLMSTPILNPPQSGILGMHKIEKRPVVRDDQIVVRPMMYVALSYDHRLVDGEQAVTFLVHVKERLEEPARLLLEV